METFVFALHLQQLRCSALVLRLQTHNPKKRTVAECVLSLRQLGSQETEHWLELNPPSKSSVSARFTSSCTKMFDRRYSQVLKCQPLEEMSVKVTTCCPAVCEYPGLVLLIFLCLLCWLLSSITHSHSEDEELRVPHEPVATGMRRTLNN